MRKFVSIIATAVITGSLAVAGAVSASANDGMGGYSVSKDIQVSAAEIELPVIPLTEETPVEAPAEALTEASTEAPTEAPVQTPSSADAEAKALNAVTSTGDKPEDFSVSSAVYDNAGGFWTITVRRNNGNDIRIYKVTGDTVTRTDIDESTIIATTAASTTTAKAQSTTTAAATKAAAKSTSKNSSPKTGVAFPAIPVAGLAIAAVAVAFTLKKKEN